MKQVRTYLRMFASGGDFPLPTSEQAYMQNIDLIDVAIPANGGRLRADGTWLQESVRLESPFAQGLSAIAREAGQSYVPAVSVASGWMVILDDPALQEVAAQNLVELALSGRFDSPWDAVEYDALDVPPEYRDKHHDFILLLSCRVRQAGLPFHLSYYGADWDYNRYLDPRVIAQAADFFDCYCYSPGTTWTHGRTVKALDYNLECGVDPQRMALGLAGYSAYWPITGQPTRHDITYDQAIQIVQDNNSFVQWIESDDNGLMRLKYADVGEGHLWLTDADVVRSRLELLDSYGLAGMMHFTPGLEDEDVWQVIADWKQPAPEPERAPTRRAGATGLTSSDWASGGCLIGMDRG